MYSARKWEHRIPLYRSSRPEAFPYFKHFKLSSMSLTENKVDPPNTPTFFHSNYLDNSFDEYTYCLGRNQNKQKKSYHWTKQLAMFSSMGTPHLHLDGFVLLTVNLAFHFCQNLFMSVCILSGVKICPFTLTRAVGVITRCWSYRAASYSYICVYDRQA